MTLWLGLTSSESGFRQSGTTKLDGVSMTFSVRRTAGALLLASTSLTAMPALAQDAEEVDANEIVVTAHKRSENLQNVPISIPDLGTSKLEQLNI
ncbi:MAG: hypothetical protein ACK564_08535 [Novosphingobium sp.]